MPNRSPRGFREHGWHMMPNDGDLLDLMLDWVPTVDQSRI